MDEPPEVYPLPLQCLFTLIYLSNDQWIIVSITHLYRHKNKGNIHSLVTCMHSVSFHCGIYILLYCRSTPWNIPIQSVEFSSTPYLIEENVMCESWNWFSVILLCIIETSIGSLNFYIFIAIYYLQAEFTTKWQNHNPGKQNIGGIHSDYYALRILCINTIFEYFTIYSNGKLYSIFN